MDNNQEYTRIIKNYHRCDVNQFHNSSLLNKGKRDLNAWTWTLVDLMNIVSISKIFRPAIYYQTEAF